MPIRAVCFDVGETLIDETREWNGWADFLGVPRLTLFTALGVSMWRGESHRKVFEIFRPDLDLPRPQMGQISIPSSLIRLLILFLMASAFRIWADFILSVR